MNLAAKIAAAQAAEADCAAWRERIAQSRAHLGDELRRTATPGRIVVSGLALGAAFGLKAPSAGPSLAGQFLGGPVFSMVLEAVLPGLIAGITAAAGLQTEEEATEEVADEDTAESEEAGRGPAQAS